MDIKLINDILNLKEEEGYEVISLSFILKNGKPNIQFDADIDFSEMFEDYVGDLTSLAVVQSLLMLDILKNNENKNLITELENGETVCPLSSVNVIGNENENEVKIFNSVSLSNVQSKELSIRMTDLEMKLTNKLKSILENYLSNEDNFRDFQLIFKKDGNDNLKYEDFCRLTDRPIPQQKNEIRELLDKNIEIIVNDELNKTNIEFNSNEKIVACFTANMNDITNLSNLKFGTVSI